MYEGKPMVLVIGGSDTGRTPIAAALLRKALGVDVIVRTAGVLSHEGESAAPEAHMALEQIGIDISRHVSRSLQRDDHANAELLLAVDRGTELVLFGQFPNDPRVACLSQLADLPDVLDPHRMPLGVWIATMRQLQTQVEQALPAIRERLGIKEPRPLPVVTHPNSPRETDRPRPAVSSSGSQTEWTNDSEMQRLMSLIGSADSTAETVSPVDDQEAGNATTAWREPADQHQDAESVWQIGLDDRDAARIDAMPLPAAPPPADRKQQVHRMIRMLEVAEEMPEIIDGKRLRQELIARLRSVSQQSAGAADFTPAATLMIEGKLAQPTVALDRNGLYILRLLVKQLETPVSAADLATIGSDMAEW